MSGLAFVERLHAKPKVAARATRSPQDPRRVKIVATACHAPPNVETSVELAPKVGRSEDWILSRTGIRARRIADDVEHELTYPGRIKVTVIRETRATEMAQ